MSRNFFVDFAVFFIFGLLAGAEWMVAFSIATFAATLTGVFKTRSEEHWKMMRARKVPANRHALPAFRRDCDRGRHRR